MSGSSTTGFMPAGLPELFRIHPEWAAVDLLNQARLPGEEAWVTLGSAEEVARSIRRLHVRGAPAIGIAGALGFALELGRFADDVGEPGAEDVRRIFDLLVSSRPTGRNLAWALERVREAFEVGPARRGASGDGPDGPEGPPPPATAEALPLDVRVGRARKAALNVWAGEAARCSAIGRHGLALLPEEGARVLLHCNAGALATGGIGTATAPLYLAHQAGTEIRVVAGETRPVLQGARLTAWELSRAGIPVTVVTDSMTGALMARGAVDLVMVGADAVTLDGTVINKIGTYGLAVLARHHGLPFYVAAPLTTVDALLDGASVPIEERGEDEVRRWGNQTTVPPEASVWNPAFDRTPPHLVTAIITEEGVIRPPYRPRLEDLAQAPPEAIPQA